jgi:hypothetical protein
VALIFSVVGALVWEAGIRAKANPAQASRLETLRGYLRWK